MRINAIQRIGKFQFWRDSSGQLWRRKINAVFGEHGAWEKVKG